MIIKKAKFKKVKVWRNQQVSPEVYGCDECKKEIKDYPNEDGRLDVTVFHHHEEQTERLHFCSWKCVFKKIPKIKSDYFISLPHVYCDERDKKGFKELVKILKTLEP